MAGPGKGRPAQSSNPPSHQWFRIWKSHSICKSHGHGQRSLHQVWSALHEMMVFAAENEHQYSSSSYARADNPGMHDTRRLGAEYSGMPPSHSKRVFKLSQATLRMVDQSGWSKAQKVQCSFVRSGLHRCCSHWSHPTDDAHPNAIKYHTEPALTLSLSHFLAFSLSHFLTFSLSHSLPLSLSLSLLLSLSISFPHLPSVSLSLTNSLALIEPKQDEMLFWLHLIVLPRSLQAEPDRGIAGMGGTTTWKNK